MTLLIDYAKVRVVRAESDLLQLRVEVSSDEGKTWRELPFTTGKGGVQLVTEKGYFPTVIVPLAVHSELNGEIDLTRVVGED